MRHETDRLVPHVRKGLFGDISPREARVDPHVEMVTKAPGSRANRHEPQVGKWARGAHRQPHKAIFGFVMRAHVLHASRLLFYAASLPSSSRTRPAIPGGPSRYLLLVVTRVFLESVGNASLQLVREGRAWGGGAGPRRPPCPVNSKFR